MVFLLTKKELDGEKTPSQPSNTPVSTEKGKRDNTSLVLVPEATGPDDITYTYNLHGSYEVFPLTAGNGTYTIGVYENISGTSYSTALSCSTEVSITNEFGPYLYPNQYVNFTAGSLPIDKAADLAYTANSDIEVIENVYNYIISNFTYYYDKAASVFSGYLPVVDEIYLKNTGVLYSQLSQQHQICIQLAAVLQAVVSQKLLPTTDGKMVPAFEIMVLTPAIRNLIRERKVHQIDGIIYTSSNENMISMDTSIYNLYKAGVISRHTAISEAVNPEMMEKKINQA